MIYNNNSLINEINKINKIKYPYLNFKSNKFLFGHSNNQLQIDRNDLSLSNLDFLNIKIRSLKFQKVGLFFIFKKIF